MLNVIRNGYFYCVLSKPWLTLFLLVCCIGLLSTQLPNLKIDASSDALTLEYDADLDYFREISKRYQSGDYIVVTYTPKEDLFDDNTLSHLTALRDELLTIEGISGANSILDVPLLYSPPLTLAEVSKGFKTLLNDNIDYSLARKEFLNSPIYENMLLGPDGKTTAIFLALATDDRYIELVRERDALRKKRDTDGISEDEKAQLEQISAEFLDYRTQFAAKSYKRVQIVRSVIEKYKSDAVLFVGGVSMITADMVDFINSDITVFGLGIFIFIVIILSIIFRQWQFVFLPLFSCFLSLVTMLGFLAAIDWRLTIISSNFVALLLILSLMITIHLIVRYRELCVEKTFSSDADIVKETMSFMFKPCLYTALTTMVAFVSLVVSGIRPVIDFGWMMTIGLCVAFICSFVVIPAGLMALPKTKAVKAEDKTTVITHVFSRFTEKRGGIIIALSIVAVVISVIGISRLKVENRFIDYFHSSTEIYQGMLVIDQQLGGTITLDVVLDKKKKAIDTANSNNNRVSVVSDEFGSDGLDPDDPFSSDPFAPPPMPDEVNEFNVTGDDPFAEDPFSSDPFASVEGDPFADETLTAKPKKQKLSDNYWFSQVGMERIEEVHDYLDGLSEVGKVQSLAVAYKVARDLNGRSLNDFELAFLGQALPDDLVSFLIKPYLADGIDQTRLSMRVKETDINLQRDELIKEVKNHLINELGLEEEQVHLTGVLVLYNNMLQSLFSSQILTIGAVFIGILFMFLFLFRSISLSLIALIPNMLAALVVLGGMGLIGIPLDMMTITIAAIAVGIGVDDAVHYIYRYREEFKKEKNYISAMHNAHASIGKAMYFTSVTVIVGFSILALSKFIPSIYFGLLTGLAMFTAIISSLTLLPKLILMFEPLGPESVEQKVSEAIKN